jgi:hypothetical protein
VDLFSGILSVFSIISGGKIFIEGYFSSQPQKHWKCFLRSHMKTHRCRNLSF